MENIIIKVESGSIADEMGIEPGDLLLEISGQPVVDVFDYRYMIKDEFLDLLIKKPDGQQWELEIEKDEEEDLGLIFGTGLMDRAKTCSNKCIFCFIDQLPKGMRSTLYFKDDDSRLSFLQGNYVSLTNINEEELERVIFYHLSPINISVHTTDLHLREFMLKNPNAKKLMYYIKKLYSANIEMNFQIVLCKGVNDESQLDKSIGDLAEFIPKARSLSIVPVGISRYRDGLFAMSPFEQEDAIRVIEQVVRWQKKIKQEKGSAFVFASDEFYLKAERKLPRYKDYEDFPQLENGVGMLTLLEHDFNKALAKTKTATPKNIVVVTGSAAHGCIKNLAQKACQKFPDLTIEVIHVDNIFFGQQITVSGLLTGRDILYKLKQIPKPDIILIPANALRAGETVFLDDTNLEDIQRELGVNLLAVATTGTALAKALTMEYLKGDFKCQDLLLQL